MPSINGIELCRMIRSHYQKLPIFFCSGAVTEGAKKIAFEAGAQSYFGKPFDAGRTPHYLTHRREYPTDLDPPFPSQSLPH